LNGLDDDEVKAEVPRLLTDLGKIAYTTSGWGLLNAIAYPDGNHQNKSVELILWDQANHNAEMSPQFGLGLNDLQKEAILTDGTGVNCSFVVKAGEDKDSPGANHVNNPFLPTPSDIVLYHELVHGYHFQNGTVDRTVLDNNTAQNAAASCREPRASPVEVDDRAGPRETPSHDGHGGRTPARPSITPAAAHGQAPLRRTVTPSPPAFDTTRSALPSPFRSPAAMPYAPMMVT